MSRRKEISRDSCSKARTSTRKLKNSKRLFTTWRGSSPPSPARTAHLSVEMLIKTQALQLKTAQIVLKLHNLETSSRRKTQKSQGSINSCKRTNTCWKTEVENFKCKSPKCHPCNGQRNHNSPLLHTTSLPFSHA